MSIFINGAEVFFFEPITSDWRLHSIHTEKTCLYFLLSNVRNTQGLSDYIVSPTKTKCWEGEIKCILSTLTFEWNNTIHSFTVFPVVFIKRGFRSLTCLQITWKFIFVYVTINAYGFNLSYKPFYRRPQYPRNLKKFKTFQWIINIIFCTAISHEPQTYF